MSRELEREVARVCGMPHSIFKPMDTYKRKEDERWKDKINPVGLLMRKRLLEKGWKVATELQAYKAMHLENPEFRCTAISCGCVGQRVTLFTKGGKAFHDHNDMHLFGYWNFAYQYGAGQALLISPKTRRELEI